MKKQVFISPYGNLSEHAWQNVLDTSFPNEFSVETIWKAKKGDFIIFDGGEDVTPSFYREVPHPSTHSSLKRDLYEKSLFLHYANSNIKMIGICRGNQFLNVMTGGTLIQDMYSILGVNHSRYHNAFVTETSNLFKYVGKHYIKVNSTHHQAINETGKNSIVTLCSDGIIEGFETDKIRAVQCHPEYIYDNLEEGKILRYLFRMDE